MSSSSSACTTSGASKGPKTDDPKRAPAAFVEQSAKKDRRPLGFASIGAAGRGCCCHAKDKLNAERMMQILAVEIIVNLRSRKIL